MVLVGRPMRGRAFRTAAAATPATTAAAIVVVFVILQRSPEVAGGALYVPVAAGQRLLHGQRIIASRAAVLAGQRADQAPDALLAFGHRQRRRRRLGAR